MNEDRGDDAAVSALADSMLFCHIAAFQSGYPQAVATMVRSATPEQMKQALGFVGGAFLHRRQLQGALPRIAVAADDLQAAKYLYELKMRPQYQSDPLFEFSDVIRMATRLRSVCMLECLAELMERDPTWQWEPDLLPQVLYMAERDVRVLEWLYQHLPPEMRELQPHDMDIFASRGDLEMVQWLRAHGCSLSAQTADRAALSSNGALVAYLYQHTDARCSPNGVVDAAALSGLEVVKIVMADQTEETKLLAMNAAARCGNLAVVKYFVKFGIGVKSHRAIDDAACGGHVSVVKYLHDAIPAGCTWKAMERAAIRGHLDVVRFLHENRSEGCTVNAMNGAAARGYLDVVQFLHEHRTEGCSVMAMDGAAAGGHLHVVRFLHENRTEGCSARALEMAVRKYRSGVLEFLCEHRHECDIGQTMISVAASGYVHAVKILLQYKEARACAFPALVAADRMSRGQVIEVLCDAEYEGPSLLIQAIEGGADYLVEDLVSFSSDMEVVEAIARATALGRAVEPRILRALESGLEMAP